MRSRLRHDDTGQGMLPLMFFVSFGVLAVVVMLLLPWGAATTEKSQARTAADAAALAAVDAKKDAWKDGTRPGPSGISWLTMPGQVARAQSSGCSEAGSYADDNTADLVGCSHRGGKGRVFVRVRHENTANPDNGKAEATAVAELAGGLDLDRCRWDRIPPVSPPPPAGTGEPLWEATLTCGGWEAAYIMQNNPLAGHPSVSFRGAMPPGLYKDLEPRLVD